MLLLFELATGICIEIRMSLRWAQTHKKRSLSVVLARGQEACQSFIAVHLQVVSMKFPHFLFLCCALRSSRTSFGRKTYDSRGLLKSAATKSPKWRFAKRNFVRFQFASVFN